MKSTKTVCTVPKCQKKSKHFECILCRLSFCGWHLLFLMQQADQKIDDSAAQCLCCYLNIKRTPDYRDAPVSDTLAEALLHAEPTLRNRVIAFQLAYHDAQTAAFGPGGQDFFHPKMAPPVDSDVREFIEQNRE